MKTFLLQVHKDGVWKVAAHAQFPHVRDAITKAIQDSGWAMDRVRVRMAPEGYRAPPEHCCPDCGEPDNRFPGRDFICQGCGIVLRNIAT